MDELNEKKEPTSAEPEESPEEATREQHDGEYTGMPRARAAFLKILPMLIVLACTGLSGGSTLRRCSQSVRAAATAALWACPGSSSRCGAVRAVWSVSLVGTWAAVSAVLGSR